MKEKKHQKKHHVPLDCPRCGKKKETRFRLLCDKCHEARMEEMRKEAKT